MPFTDLFRPEGLLIDIAPASKDELLGMLAAKAAELWDVDEAKVRDKLAKREELGSTGVGGGIALPHCPSKMLTEPAVLFARLKKPVNYQAVDEKPVDIAVMALLPEENCSQHLNVLSAAARMLRDGPFVKALRSAEAGDVYGLLLKRAEVACEEKRAEAG